MANEVHIQRLRGNTARNDNYRGKDGELVINADSKSIRIHDGVKTGGYGTIDAIHYDTLPDDVPQDLRTGAHVTVGNGRLDGGNVPSTKSSVYAGNVVTGGNTGVLVVQERSEGKFYINTTFPEATIAKGEVKTEGSEGKLEIVRNSVNNFTVNATFPEDEVYAAHSDSEEGSEELKELMPDGGIIIERADGAKPVLKQIVDGELVATELSGGVQATYTADSDETDSIIDEVEEGALIIEGPGALNVTAIIHVSADAGNAIERKTDGLYVPETKISAAEKNTLELKTDGLYVPETKVSADEKNTLEMKADGLFTAGASLSDNDPVVDGAGTPGVSDEGARSDHQHPRDIQAVWVENAAETESVLPDLAEGALIVEGNEHIIVETSAKVSAAAGNAIQRKTDGIFVESVKFGKTDPGAGSTLATGSIYLVYEE